IENRQACAGADAPAHWTRCRPGMGRGNLAALQKVRPTWVGKALTGFNHEYKRHGTTTLFAALDVVTGLAKAGHYRRRRRVEFLHFMNRVLAGARRQTSSRRRSPPAHSSRLTEFRNSRKLAR